MAKKSNNTIGNPYHDEKTGQFTSEGLSAVNDQIEGRGLPSDKSRRMEETRQAVGGIRNISNKKLLNYYVDDNISIPLLMKHKEDIAYHLMSENVKVNTDDNLDKIGVDLIGWDGAELPLTVENLGRFNFVDVKTSYNNSINLTCFVAIVGGGRVRGPFVSSTALIDSRKKVNNAFVFQFLNTDSAITNTKALAKRFEKIGDLDNFAAEHITDQEIYAFSSREVNEMVGSLISRDDLETLNNDFVSFFDETGRFKESGSAKALALYLTEQFGRLEKTGEHQFKGTKEVPNWGMQLNISLDSSKPFCGVDVTIKIDRTHLQKYYMKNKC